jgi:hypothetical protein
MTDQKGVTDRELESRLRFDGDTLYNHKLFAERFNFRPVLPETNGGDRRNDEERKELHQELRLLIRQLKNACVATILKRMNDLARSARLY